MFLKEEVSLDEVIKITVSPEKWNIISNNIDGGGVYWNIITGEILFGNSREGKFYIRRRMNRE